MLCGHTDNSLSWQVGGRGTVNIKLLTTGLSVHGTAVTSDARLKVNEKPLVNAIGVINRFEPVEYDQTVSLMEQYTDGTPQFDQCGSIVQKEEKSKN